MRRRQSAARRATPTPYVRLLPLHVQIVPQAPPLRLPPRAGPGWGVRSGPPTHRSPLHGPGHGTRETSMVLHVPAQIVCFVTSVFPEQTVRGRPLSRHWASDEHGWAKAGRLTSHINRAPATASSLIQAPVWCVEVGMFASSPIGRVLDVWYRMKLGSPIGSPAGASGHVFIWGARRRLIRRKEAELSHHRASAPGHCAIWPVSSQI